MDRQKFLTFLFQVIAFFVVAFIFIKVVGWIPLTVSSVNTQKEAFQVSGEGKVSVSPDTAVVTVGVTSQGTTVSQSQETLNSNINKVTDAVKALGIPAEDIKTQNYNINPDYDFTSGQRITGYTSNTNIAIKVKDTTKVNQVIDTATSNGANQVGGVTFEVADPTQAENQAREQAVEEAKSRAQEAAGSGGFSLGRVINYSETTSGGGAPIPFAARQAADAAISNPTEIQPGTSDVEIFVTLSYEIL